MKKIDWINDYLSYKRGALKAKNDFLYIDDVIKEYGSEYSISFNLKVYELIIRMDSFFRNIKSKDVAKLLKEADSMYSTDSTTSKLRKLYSKHPDKYCFTGKDERNTNPIYIDKKEHVVWNVPKNRDDNASKNKYLYDYSSGEEVIIKISSLDNLIEKKIK